MPSSQLTTWPKHNVGNAILGTKTYSQTRRTFLKRAAAITAAGIARAFSNDAFGASPPIRVRKGIDQFSQDQQALNDLRTAVKKMRDLSPDHPFSWIFQANIHWRPFYPDYVYAQAEASTDPAIRLFRDKTGFTANPDPFNQCPHGNWWFLPWHRAYLYFFERILRWASGSSSLALPYWNYSDANQRELPDAFRNPRLGSNSNSLPNPLYLPDSATFTTPAGAQEAFPLRDASLNNGLTQLTASATDVTVALQTSAFYSMPPVPSNLGFGSPRACGLTCSCGSGALESTPHNKVHNAIGGNAVNVGNSLRVGFMGDVSTAARDPIFWLHHSNIDRLWESWLQAYGASHVNPADSEWLDQTFLFYDYDENHPNDPPFPVQISPRALLKTDDLGYRYDRLEGRGPQPAPALFIAAAPAAETLAETPPTERTTGPRRVPLGMPSPHMGAAPGAGIRLNVESQTEVQLPLASGVNKATFHAALSGKTGQASSLILVLDGIRFDGMPGVYYDLYLGLPKGGVKVTPKAEYFVGSLTFFGMGHTHGLGQPGLHSSRIERIAIPPAIVRLIQENRIDPTHMALTFVPESGTEPIPGKEVVRRQSVGARPEISIRTVRIESPK